MLQRLHIPTTQDQWFAKVIEKVKEQGEDMNRDISKTVSLLETDEELEEELPWFHHIEAYL